MARTRAAFFLWRSAYLPRQQHRQVNIARTGSEVLEQTVTVVEHGEQRELLGGRDFQCSVDQRVFRRPHQHHRDTQLLGTFSHELRPRLSWTPEVATAVRTRAELCYDWSCWRFSTCCQQTLHDHCMGRCCGNPHKRVFEKVEGDAHCVKVPNR